VTGENAASTTISLIASSDRYISSTWSINADSLLHATSGCSYRFVLREEGSDETVFVVDGAEKLE
jgi:hypothetical protein